MNSYLLEIGVEELPANYLDIAIEYLEKAVGNLLTSNNINYDLIQTCGTPRRLLLHISDLAEESTPLEKEIVGPPASIVLDENGHLNERGLQFIKAKGIDEKDIKIIETPKGKYLGGLIKDRKIDTKTLMKTSLPNVIKSLPFPKMMRWDNTNLRFARPIRWIVSLFNDEIMHFSLGNLEANRFTVGHRFMASEKIAINHCNDYWEIIKNSFVIVKKEERQNIIVNYIKNISKDRDLSFNIDQDLLNTVSNLVEFPYPICSTFPDKFLELPEEVLITSMKNHQKFFYLRDKNSKVTNAFVGVSNTKPIDDSTIAKGYSRVLKARLTDALFFFNNDKKTPLISKLEKLKNIVFQEKLGTMFDKTERLKKISSHLQHELNYNNNHQIIERIATLSKCDLLTEMVMEFPELQGIMGKIYASIQGEDLLVANGIYEHYLPRFAGDELPKSFEGAIVSIADKIDTIAGNFIVGNIPTGNLDPFGLRRKSIGIIEIFNKHCLDPDLQNIVAYVLAVYRDFLPKEIIFDVTSKCEEILTFIKQRLKQILLNEGISPDVFEAVFKHYNKLQLLKKAAIALNNFKQSEDFKKVALAYKRTNNILYKNDWDMSLSNYKKELFRSDYETKLHTMIENNMKIIPEEIKAEHFENIFNSISQFNKPLNDFFDNVMVIDKNEEIKINRLALLSSLKQCFDMVCDLSKLIY
jgi:glycyl-tRNA synthetase beta chain